jgi:chemotaxis protein MotB
MGRGRKTHAEEHEEHGPDERWMASYMDMVTVLMCMFIVLFAMSTVDAKKFDLLRNSLATGFGQTDIGKIDSAKGTIVQPDKADKNGQSFGAGQLAVKEVDKIKALEAKVSASLAVQGLQGAVQFTIDQRGLTIRLIDQQTFFTPNSTTLAGTAPRVLDTLSPILAATGEDIAVEGHADIRAPVAPFPTNWELSSGRAVSVLRRMVESGGIDPQKIGAVGYGSSRPLAAGTSPGDLAQNRRVDIVALSNASEAVRALIPNVLAGTISGSPAATGTAASVIPPSPWYPVATKNVPLVLLPAVIAGR